MTPQPISWPDWFLYALLGAAALLVFLVVALLVRRARRKRAPSPPPELAEQVRLPVELPPSPEERERVRAAEEARLKADALAREQDSAARAAKEAQSKEERARLSAEAEAKKRELEEARKQAYEAEKEAERQAKERRKREKEEEEKRRAEEEAARKKAEAEEKERAEEEHRRRVAAEAGRTLSEGLEKTKSQGFMARLNGLFGAKGKLDESVLGEMEEILFTADIGVRTASRLVDIAREKLKRNELSDSEKLKAVIRDEVEKILDLPHPPSLQGGGPPHVVMVVGVNGAGKTTTIGKLAKKLSSQGKKVVLAAGDTFRAAATEQLDVWAERAQAQLVRGPEGGDPSAVVFDAIKKAQESGADAVIADTAGRLHTKAPLMEELKKVRRVMDKALPGAPHEVLLVLDATNGQNAIAQAKQFQEVVAVTAIALTKLDGTAKGGVVIGICDELKIPVVWVGVGEKVQDLRPFEPKEFVRALFD